jgi:hypothetical protein
MVPAIGVLVASFAPWKKVASILDTRHTQPPSLHHQQKLGWFPELFGQQNPQVAIIHASF